MRARRISIVIALAGAGIGLAGCFSGPINTKDAPQPTTVAPTPETTTTTTTATASGGKSNSGGGSGGSGGSSGGGGGRQTSTSSPPSATASISVVKQPTCPRTGTPDAPFTSPGSDVVISWKVTGADGAAIAVDNPTVYGAYGTYGATGELKLSFPCDNKPGKTSHTYTVWPKGIKNVSKTITVSAQNNPST